MPLADDHPVDEAGPVDEVGPADEAEPEANVDRDWLQPDVVRLDGTVAVITGGAQGIGRATALGLARFGGDMVVVDKLGEGVEETASMVQDLGRICVAVTGDVRDPDVVDAVRSAAATGFGRVDLLVNNAGGGFWAPFDQISPKGEAALMAENFTQVAACVRAMLPLMATGGSIVNVTSIEAHRAGPGFSIYSAMKAAVENLSKTLSLELAPRGIRVNCVAPDMIPTPGDAGLIEASGAMVDDRYAATPATHRATPDDAAAAILFLASDMSRFITGATIHLDGGTFAASGWRRRVDDDAWTL